MALIVKFSPSGPNLDQLGYYDPLTGVNLSRSAPTSSDLSAFSSAQLANISQAVASSILVLVSGSLPTATLTEPATTVAVSSLPALTAGTNFVGYVGVDVGGASVTASNPMPMYDAYLAPSTVAWGSGTALNTALTVSTAGYDTVVVTAVLSGTITGGVLTWELYDGANWLSVKAPRTDSYQTDSTFTMSGSPGNHAWQIPVAGFPQFRVRLSTALTGTSPGVSLTIITSSAPDTSIVTVGLDPSQALPAGTNVLGSVGIQVSGAAVGPTNPIAIYDAYLAPVATTWTASTTGNTALTVNTGGYDTVIVTLVPGTGAITAGVFVWEVYDGVTWLGVKAPRIDSYLTDLTFAASGTTSHAWQIPVAGFSQFRVRLSSQLTGSVPQVTVTIIVSSAPDTSIVTVGLDPSQALPAGTNTLGAVYSGGTNTTSVASNTSVAVKNTAGRLMRLLVTTTGTGVFTVYDNASGASGTVIGYIAASAAAGTVVYLDMPAANGIYCVSASSGPVVTVSWM